MAFILALAAGVVPPGAGAQTISPNERQDRSLRSFVPAGYAGTPFGDSRNPKAPQRIPGRLQCELYDLGGPGVAYSDSDGKNSGSGGLNPIDGSYLNGFRAGESVDISYTKDRGTPPPDFSEFNRVTPEHDSLYLGWTEPGEWVNYTVQVEKSGAYALDVMYTSNGEGRFELYVDDALRGTITLSTTHDDADTLAWRQWHHWNRVAGALDLDLEAGLHLVRIQLLAGNTNLDYLEFRAKDRPNVVLFLMDDLGYGDPGSYGATDVRTPNIDRLAREGVKLTEAYAAAPVCTPTRAALMTGRYQQRVGLESVLTAADADRGLPATEPTLPRRLKEAGYATALIGKWHLGWKEEFRPRRHGFDEFFGFLSGAVDYYSHRNEAGQPDLYENDRPVEVEGYLTDELTARALAFVERQTAQPFFLELAYNAPHWPFEPPDLARTPDFPAGSMDDVLERWSFDGRREDYVRMLERADAGIGQVLAALDRQGLAGNTLVIFTSDNGGEWLSRMGPLFHRKGSLWEGGLRVPCLLRWTGRLPAGQVSRQTAITMDLTATILAAAGVQLPAERSLDGLDLMPLLSAGGLEIERTFCWRLAAGARTRAIRSGNWKYVAEVRFPGLLFDLGADPGERDDQASRHPEILARLRALHADWERAVAVR